MKTRVVFDANVYVGASSPGAYSVEWLEAASRLNRSFDVYTSEDILTEVQLVLCKKMRFSKSEAKSCVDELRRYAVVVEPTERIEVIERDPDDNKILECAVAARADIVISADRDLLQLRGFRGITVYHPNNLKYLFPQDFGKTI